MVGPLRAEEGAQAVKSRFCAADDLHVGFEGAPIEDGLQDDALREREPRIDAPLLAGLCRRHKVSPGDALMCSHGWFPPLNKS